MYAVDIVPAFLEHLRTREAEGLRNVEVVDGSPTAVMLPDESIDLMFMCDVYHHIEYPSVFARSLHRALRADGRLSWSSSSEFRARPRVDAQARAAGQSHVDRRIVG